MTDLTRLSSLFWNLFRARISSKDIDAVLKKEFDLYLIGDRELTEALRKALLEGAIAAEGPEERFPSLEELPESGDDREKLEKSMGAIIVHRDRDVTIDGLGLLARRIPRDLPVLFLMIGEEECLEGDEIDAWGKELELPAFVWVPDLAHIERTRLAARMLDDFTLLELPLARCIPLLREESAKRLIVRTAMQNMVIALASSVPANIPVVGIITGALAVTGETIFLTANQAKLCLKIAGLYGFETDLVERMKELWPLLGGAVTWRALARSGVGFLPVAGPVIKAAMAYAGTYLTGEVALWFYAKGIKMSVEDQKEIFRKAKEEALGKAQELIRSLKGCAGEDAPPAKERAAGDTALLEPPPAATPETSLLEPPPAAARETTLHEPPPAAAPETSLLEPPAAAAPETSLLEPPPAAAPDTATLDDPPQAEADAPSAESDDVKTRRRRSRKASPPEEPPAEAQG